MYNNFRSIIFIVGIFSLVLALLMLIPLVIDIYTQNEYRGFLIGFLFTFFSGIILIICGRLAPLDHIGVFNITSCVWLSLTCFSAIPFSFSALDLNYADALFEATSGITTTGATLLLNLQEKSPGILLWRCILQAIGGLGVILLGILIFPFLKVVNIYSLYQSESSDITEKFLPNTSVIALHISAIYGVFIILCASLYYIFGMNFFDSICHAMSTVSTGGFSNYDDSIKHFNNVYIDIIAMFFMILSSCPFVVYLKALYKIDFYDEQFSYFLKLILISSVLSAFWLYSYTNINFEENRLILSLRYGFFTIISIISSTGFMNYNYDNLHFISVLIFFLSFVGGCTGSTNSGIKVYRLIILIKSTGRYIRSILQPHRITKIYFNSKSVDEQLVMAVHGFFFLYIIIFVVACIMMSLSGVDFITALTAVSSTLTNVGPGLGDTVGPTGNYQSLMSFVKLLLSFLMLVGRLEIISIFAFLFSLFYINK